MDDLKEPMPRTFSRPVEVAVRVLRQICEDPKTPVLMRVRCAELILSAYGHASLRPEQVSKHNGLRQIQGALELSGIDRKIAGRARKERKDQSLKLKTELAKL
jgi:hypothetical protein